MSSMSVHLRACATAALCAFLTLAVTEPAAAQAKNTRFGVVMTPANLPVSSDEEVQRAILETAGVGGHVSYLWEWRTGDEAHETLSLLLPIYRQLGLKLLLQVSPSGLGTPTPPPGFNETFADPDLRARFLQDVRRLAELHPEYLNLAAEINLMYYFNPTEFGYFKTLYAEAYDVVKEVSPQTKVGVSYHLDMLFAFEQYELALTLGPQDYLGLSSYPSWLLHKNVFPSMADIPTGYYDRIRILVPDMPVVFTEVGWPSAGGGTEAEQAAFIRELPRLLENTNPELITWSLLHDVAHFRVEALNAQQRALLEDLGVNPELLFEELNSIGLLHKSGLPKAGWDAANEVVFDY